MKDKNAFEQQLFLITMIIESIVRIDGKLYFSQGSIIQSSHYLKKVQLHKNGIGLINFGLLQIGMLQFSKQMEKNIYQIHLRFALEKM